MSTIRCDGDSREVEAGRTLFDYADALAVELPSSCKRTGRCHECVVEVKQGSAALRPRNQAESFLRGDFRLACQATIESDDIDIAFALLRRKPRILTISREMARSAPDPMVVRHGDEVLYDGEVIDRYRGRLLGLAIDLGTTTIVMTLVDLETGRGIRTSSFESPQRFGGSDVMNRISYDGESNKGELQKSAVAAVNREIVRMCRSQGFSTAQLYEIAVAGNSTMRDIFFKIDVQSIGQRPYKSLVELAYRAGERPNTALLENARRLGLRANARAKVYGLPLIACHVGADMAANLVAVDMASNADRVVMLVDVGTNTEVVIGRAGRMLAASCPAGPAFEGTLITYGMCAYDGAIESISMGVGGGQIEYRTIGGAPPEGVCGSGFIDLLAELRRHGIMTPKGVFTADRKQREFMVVPECDITFSREDASNLGQAKAANYCGQMIVMREFGVVPADISRLYLAGGFANYVNVRNAIDIGFLPPVPEERIVKIGNAAIQGTREVLIDRRKRAALEEMVKGIGHVELETSPDFFDVFVDGCQFKPMPELAPAAAD